MPRFAMSNMNVDAVAGSLVKMGIAYKCVIKTEEPEFQPDVIVISHKVHVHVSAYGDCFVTVNRLIEDDTWVAFPERLDIALVAMDVRNALKESMK